ncbi:MAG: molybdenum ABC transporter ATP-binding protein [Caulobacterales bacterium]
MLRVDVDRVLGAFAIKAAFEAPAQGVTTLFGPSGSGKSSILAMLAGAIKPERGHIAIGARVLFDSRSGVNVPMEARRIGWVFQDSRLFPHLDVRRNLLFGLERAPESARTIGFDSVIQVLGLEHFLARAPRHLSGGEKQRVALGRALLAQPQLLLLDEPLAALDSTRKAEIIPFLSNAVRQFALPALYVTHSLAETVRMSDHLVLIQNGAVAASGPPAALLARTDLPMLNARADTGALIHATILERSIAGALCDIGGAQLRAPVDGAVGERVRLYVFARDVILALQPPVGLSVRNHVTCRIIALSARAQGGVLASLQAGDAHFIAAITEGAVRDLNLRTGLDVVALIKASALEGGTRGLLDALG